MCEGLKSCDRVSHKSQKQSFQRPFRCLGVFLFQIFVTKSCWETLGWSRKVFLKNNHEAISCIFHCVTVSYHMWHVTVSYHRASWRNGRIGICTIIFCPKQKQSRLISVDQKYLVVATFLVPSLQLSSIGCQWTSNSSQSYSQMANNKSSLGHDENNDRESQVCCLFLSSNYVACKTKKAHENLRKCHVTGQIPSFLICPDHKPDVISDWAQESPLSNHKWDEEQPQTGLRGFGGKWSLPSLLQILTQSQATEIWIGQKS